MNRKQIYFWLWVIAIVLLGIGFTSTPYGATSASPISMVGLLMVMGLIGIGIWSWTGRTWDQAFAKESPQQIQRAVALVQAQARAQLGRELTQDELNRWYTDRRHTAQVKLLVAGGIVLLNTFHRPE